MDSANRPQPRPRHHRGRHRGAVERRYSSSDNEDTGCRHEGCSEICSLRGPVHAGRRPRHEGQRLGLTPDERHISPIENLDNTISRLYSYLSGSEGEPDPDQPLNSPQRRDNWQQRNQHPHHHHHHSQRSRSVSPSVSSGSSRSCSPSEPCYSDHDDHELDRTIDSAGTGENVYSRINETATLPMPPIPPPPLEEPGPEVPPRTNLKRLTPAQTQTGEMDPGMGRHRAHTDGESDFEPQFLVQTASGNVFVPHDSPPASPPLPFPRTVPRTNSLPPQSGQPRAPVDYHANMNKQSRPGVIPEVPNDGTPQSNMHPSSSTERIKLQLKEMELENWARQNVTYNPNASQLAPLPTYPSVQNDFRDYSHFNTASYRVEKHLKRKCSWKCTALIFMLLTVLLLALLAYFVVITIQGTNGRQERLADDLNNTVPSHTLSSPTDGATLPTTPSVIVVQYPLGTLLENSIPPRTFWRTQFYMSDSEFVKFNFSVPTYAVIGVYGRRNMKPTHAQYDFFHVLDGSKILQAEAALADSRSRRSPKLRSPGDQASAFIHYMESGLWYIFVYNDNDETEKVSFIGNEHDDVRADCPNGCHGRGECRNGQCRCFPGYTGWDCAQRVCPVLCKGRGIYVHGKCRCHSDWKGQECDVPAHDCEDPTCSGNGQCVGGNCVCSKGFTGKHCQEVDCLSPNCSGHGVCSSGGRCVCFPGYAGSDCSLAQPQNPSNVTLCVRDCSSHGVFDLVSQHCRCEEGWTGLGCETELCGIECVHGHCENQRCTCSEGWTGAHCDQQKCDQRCYANGYCHNGTCTCKQGWNGDHCSLDGCPNSCNNHGSCRLFHDGWKCSCRDGWKGDACDVAMEMVCEDEKDEDGDGLIDCQDSDCCVSISCKEDQFCVTSPDPMEILLRKQPPSPSASFYDRMRFLVEDDSVQGFASISSFNQSQVSVIRGRVISADGSPLIGIRVDVVTQPLYGFTLTRELGLFDILVNGGGSVTLQFLRRPFETKQTTVMVPWNRMVTMDTVVLTIKDQEVPEPPLCEDVSHDHYVMRPVVLSTWQHTQLGSCPSKSTIIPESQVLQESLHIPGTDVYLVYHSSESPGYMSTIMIQLTPDQVPTALVAVHLRVTVEGWIFERVFEADPGIKYKFAWDRRNAYNQKVYGIVTASVGVGYQYADCSRIFWEMQSATMSGYDITSSEIGGWNLHIHHTYNFQEGILHKGDGTNIYLKERPRKVMTVLGNGKQRRINCRGCDGTADNSRLLAPVALASGRDGSLYVGDFNYVRKLSSNRDDVTNVLELDMPETYKYFMTVSPLDGKLYISDYHRRQIMRVKTMGAVRELTKNFEVVAGTGKQCVPGDKEKCGDGDDAVKADLYYPKGIAINKDGITYFADGANIRVIDNDGVITTLIGSQGQPVHWSPMPCNRVLSTDEATLHSPSALAINPLDDTLHMLDNNMVLKVTKDGKILIVAGRPLHCPPRNPNVSSLLSEEQSGPKLATDVILESPQHIAFAPNGDLFIVETDSSHINRIRVVNTDGTIQHYVGGKPKCNCDLEDCSCYEPKEILATKVLLHNPTAITVTPDNVLHIADMGNLRIHSVVATLPEPDRFGQYEVLYPQTQELYVFNRYGQHTATRNLINNQYVYNFTYNVNSYYGKLVSVVDSGRNALKIVRDYTTQAKEMLPPGGQTSKFTMDNMGQLHKFVGVDNASTTFTYLSNTGLLETKESSRGLTFLYEYDENGRLSHVVQPTGERTTIRTDVDPTGAIARLSTENTDRVALTTNGNMLSVLHGNARTKVSYLHDGALVVEYPFNMAITMETSPHPLLSTQHQLHVRRKIILPDNLVHRLEWRYYLRYPEQDAAAAAAAGDSAGDAPSAVGRHMRVGKAPSRHGARVRYGETSHLHASESSDSPNGGGYEGKILMVNGENLLTLEYDREQHSEFVYNSTREERLRIQYNNAGQLTGAFPAGTTYGVNVTYDTKGQMTKWSRVEQSIVNVYDDKTGHLTERKYGNLAAYQYVYRTGNKPTDVFQPSGKQYQLHYDQYGNLRAVVMPSQARHRFHSLTSLTLHRQMYTPPGGHSPYIRDYNSNGKLQQVLYPSTLRRVTYSYTDSGKLDTIFHDWMDIKYGYHNKSGVLHSMNLTSEVMQDYSCALLFHPGNALVQKHSVLFRGSSIGLLNVTFHYHYDKHFRVVGLDTEMGGKFLRQANYSFSASNGKIEKMKLFTFEYPEVVRSIIRDGNIEIIQHKDNYGRVTHYWYRFNNHVIFTLEIRYDNLDRIVQWRRKVGSSDQKSYEYIYDVDSNVIEVLLNGPTAWKYDFDVNSNIQKMTHHDRVTELEINNLDQIESNGEESYIFDQDGFLTQRDGEVFEYNSLGQLVRAFELGKYDIFYYYDAEGRFVARHDAIGGYLMQFFYADLQNKNRVTHMYDHSKKEVTALYYDSEGRLFSMERNNNFFYVALDPIGSPILIFNSRGIVIKQITYDPLGLKVTDSDPNFPFILGFQCGVMDHITKLIHLNERIYDPTTGRWTSPNYENVLRDIGEIMDRPGVVNLYQNGFIVNQHLQKPQNLMLGLTDWLQAIGYDLNSLIPDVTYGGAIRSENSQLDAQKLMPVTSAFECAFQRDMQNFVELSTVPQSKVTGDVTPEPVEAFAPFGYIFGEGVLLSVDSGRVIVDILDSANERLAFLATTLLNNSQIVNLHYTLHGRDMHYFVKSNLDDAKEDVKELSLREDTVNIQGINVTIHQHHESPDVMKFADIRLHGNHTVLNVRYGMTLVQETERILAHARERAVESAWLLERDSSQSKKQSINTWTRKQRDELISKGSVSGVKSQYIRDINRYPKLADDPKNIQFVPASR